MRACAGACMGGEWVGVAPERGFAVSERVLAVFITELRFMRPVCAPHVLIFVLLRNTFPRWSFLLLNLFPDTAGIKSSVCFIVLIFGHS